MRKMILERFIFIYQVIARAFNKSTRFWRADEAITGFVPETNIISLSRNSRVCNVGWIYVKQTGGVGDIATSR